MPRRPQWSYDDSLETLERRERCALDEWMSIVKRDERNEAFFERNLETWRQLWRVIERSDVLVLVADIRFPALHFVPDLYHYVNGELNKGIVLALNKCDLVPLTLLNAWRDYFKKNFPDMAIAMFSSFPDAKLSPSEANSELLSKRERRMARSKLSAWGADQLLEAIDTLNLDTQKKQYLSEWRQKLHKDVEEENDDLLSEPLRPDLFLNDTVSAKRQRSRPVRSERISNVESESSDTDSGADDIASESTTSRSPAGSGKNDESAQEERLRDEMITIGMVGHPNAGKSSMINGIFQRKVVSTSRTPGHTKHLQTMFLSDRVRVCDCPGLVFPGIASRELQILAGMFPVSQVREPYPVVKYLAERVDLVKVLNLDAEVERLEAFNEEKNYVKDGWTAWKICEAWAMKRGFRTAKAARLDVFRAANNILRLAVEGRIVLATVPTGFKATMGSNAEEECTENCDSESSARYANTSTSASEHILAESIAKETERKDATSESESESESDSDDDDGTNHFMNSFMLLGDDEE